MKSFLRDRLPDSLLGQLMLALLLGVALLQGVNFFTVCNIQTTFLNQAETLKALHLAEQARLLDALEPGQRAAVAGAVGKTRTPDTEMIYENMMLRAEPPDWSSDAAGPARRFARLLQENLGEDGAGSPPSVLSRVLNSGSSAPDAPRVGFPFLQTAVRLNDGSWLTVIQPLHYGGDAEIWTQRLLILAESVVLAVLIVVLLLRLTRPLRRLGQEVEAFGRRPESSSPLPENGSREMREAAQSFNRMRERIRDHLEERDNMLAAMAHDLRTPLTRAQLRLGKLHPQEERDKLAANIEEIQMVVEQGLELAGSLKSSEKPVPVDIVAFVQSVVDDAVSDGDRAILRDNGANNGSSNGDGETRPLLVLARPFCLKRCLDNLICNAVTYGGNAELYIAATEDSVIVEIADNGPGIPEDMLERVFTPYFRLEASRCRSYGGVGLGLSIARNMAALNSGTLILRNRPEGGLAARLELVRKREGG